MNMEKNLDKNLKNARQPPVPIRILKPAEFKGNFDFEWGFSTPQIAEMWYYARRFEGTLAEVSRNVLPYLTEPKLQVAIGRYIPKEMPEDKTEELQSDNDSEVEFELKQESQQVEKQVEEENLQEKEQEDMPPEEVG